MSTPVADHRPDTRAATRATAAATMTATLAILPVFLVGATAVSLRSDLGFSAGQLGVATACFWATMALGGVPGGRIVQRLGATRAIRSSAAASVVVLVGLATSPSFVTLCLWMLAAGLVSGFGNPATDLTIASTVPDHRRGLAFGIKQSAVPTATLLAGLAVPALALTVGWRWAFVVGATIAAPLLLTMPAVPRAPEASRRVERTGDSDMRAVVLLAVAAGLAMAAMTAMGAFYVESAHASGVGEDTAGVLLAGGSVFGIAGRFGFAWTLADTRRPFLAVAVLTGAGGIGLVAMILGATAGPLFLGTAVAFGAGWGWNGLFVHAVVRANPNAPAAAMGVIVSGTAAGGVVGPLVFGLVTESNGYPVAWTLTGGAFVAASLLMLLTSRVIGSHRHATTSAQATASSVSRSTENGA